MLKLSASSPEKRNLALLQNDLKKSLDCKSTEQFPTSKWHVQTT